MIKVFAMYKRPRDEKAFWDHYNNVHVPIAKKIPGLSKLVLNRVTGSGVGGEPPYYLIAEMHFPDKETFKAAMKSPENAATTRDAMSFAADIITPIIVEEI